jgi:hypothetical protein
MILARCWHGAWLYYTKTPMILSWFWQIVAYLSMNLGWFEHDFDTFLIWILYDFGRLWHAFYMILADCDMLKHDFVMIWAWLWHVLIWIFADFRMILAWFWHDAWLYYTKTPMILSWFWQIVTCLSMNLGWFEHDFDTFLIWILYDFGRLWHAFYMILADCDMLKHDFVMIWAWLWHVLIWIFADFRMILAWFWHDAWLYYTKTPMILSWFWQIVTCLSMNLGWFEHDFDTFLIWIL